MVPKNLVGCCASSPRREAEQGCTKTKTTTTKQQQQQLKQLKQQSAPLDMLLGWGARKTNSDEICRPPAKNNQMAATTEGVGQITRTCLYLRNLPPVLSWTNTVVECSQTRYINATLETCPCSSVRGNPFSSGWRLKVLFETATAFPFPVTPLLTTFARGARYLRTLALKPCQQ